LSEGVFQTDREIFSNPVWKNVLKFRLFFFIYGNAVYLEAGKDYSSMHINRGQLLKSYRKLQEGLEYIENRSIKQYSLSQIKKAIDELIDEKRLTKFDTELGTLFTVCNYEEYQGFERFNNENLERRKNGERTEKERRKNNNKKDKNDKKDNNNIYTQNFEKAYKIYPRPQAKIDTFKNWNKLLDKYTEEQLLQFTQNYVDYYNSIPDSEKPYAYSSNNFFGVKAYYQDFMQPSKWEGKLNNNTQQNKPANMANFGQRTYDDDYYNGLYKNIGRDKNDTS